MPHVDRSSSVFCLLSSVFSALIVSTALGQSTLSPILTQVGIDQKLDTQLPLNLPFLDETGHPVHLSDYFTDKPIVLNLVYYECPSLCSMSLNGLTRALKPLGLDAGQDFTLLTISFDPRETPQLASQKKQNYITHLGRPSAASGWHFLTGSDDSIRQLTQSVGFRYTWDESSSQFAHSTALIILTPKGRTSRYLYGLDYAPRDLRLALIEASQNRIGTLSDQILMLCYKYDPLTGRYGFAITTALRTSAIATLLILTTFITVMVRRERRNKRITAPPPAPGSTGGPPVPNP